MSQEGGSQVVARVAAILRALDGADEGLSLSELATRSDLPRSTVHRLVLALRREGLVMASRSGRTRIGPEFLRLAHANRSEMTEELHPILERLRADLDETVDLAVLDGEKVRFIDQISAPHRLRAISGIGEAFPLYCSAGGRILLAELPPDARPALVGTRLEALTTHTQTDPAVVLDEIEKAGRRGYAVTRDQMTDGISAVSVAVRDSFGTLAALSVPVPTQRFNGREKEIAKALLAVKSELEKAHSG